MTIRDMTAPADDLIPVQTVLLSVSDKAGLDELVRALIEINPGVKLLSTGGTATKIRELLGEGAERNLQEVSDYTKFPEMEGGLVKTIDGKLFAGILGERHNPAHQKYLGEMKGVYVDMVVVNLYPFQQTVADPNVSFEKARGNIDIGGPNMVRGAAKNFIGCAPVCDPNDYRMVVDFMRANNGCTSFDMRFALSVKAWDHIAEYAVANAKYMKEQQRKGVEAVRACYNFRR